MNKECEQDDQDIEVAGQFLTSIVFVFLLVIVRAHLSRGGSGESFCQNTLLCSYQHLSHRHHHHHHLALRSLPCGKILQKRYLFCNLPCRVNKRFCAGGNFWEAKIIIFSFLGKLWFGRLNIKFAAAIKL